MSPKELEQYDKRLIFYFYNIHNVKYIKNTFFFQVRLYSCWVANVQLMEEDFLSWSMDEIEMKQKLGKEIKVVTGVEAIQRTSRNVLQRWKLNSNYKLVCNCFTHSKKWILSDKGREKFNNKAEIKLRARWSENK